MEPQIYGHIMRSNSENKEIKKGCTTMLNYLIEQINTYLESDTILIATVADPRFKKLKFIQDDDLKKRIYKKIKSNIKDVDKSKKEKNTKNFFEDIMDEVNQDFSNEFDEYLNDNDININTSAITWWMNKKDVFPQLF